MPIQDTKQKGNLYVKFDIIFPKNLPEEAKIELRTLLHWLIHIKNDINK